VTDTHRRLPARVAFYVEASIIVCFLAASSAPTPLYGEYQREWGFSALTVTVVFGVYALAVLVALLTVGSLSDHVGRRPTLLAALALQAVALVVFASADGIATLMAGRIVQGLATGLAAGAVGAGMLDLDRSKGVVANAVAPLTGTGLGALVSGLLVQYLPAPTRLVYLALLGVVVVQGAAVVAMAETAPGRPGALRSLLPHFDLPAATRKPLLVAAPALVAGWALGGFYGSLGPRLVALVSGSGSVVLGGLALFVLAGAGALTVLVLRNVPPGPVALAGTAALAVGVSGTLVATAAGSAVAFFVATAVAGVGFGGGLQGAIRTVLPFADDEHRAGVLAVIYIVSYLALGLPAVVAGLVLVRTGDLRSTAYGYGVVVVVLAVVAFVGLARSSRSARAASARVATAPLLCPERTFSGACGM
jgi:predicted MFS family arabinose efflux permease